MTNVEIFSALRPIIIQATGVAECIYGDPNQFSPQGLFCAVRVSQTSYMRGTAQHSRVVNVAEQTITDTLKKQMMASVSIIFYREGAYDAASKLVGCNFRSDVSALLYQAGIGWRGTQPINNVSSMLHEEVEERSQITIDIMYTQTDECTYNTIEKAQFTFENEQGEEIFTTDIDFNGA